MKRIVSGGQTGVDQGALWAAQKLGIPTGGWVPKGRQCEDGIIPASFGELRESDSEKPRVRTQLNVRDSDATLILTRGKPTGGTALTHTFADQLQRSVLVVDLDALEPEEAVGRIRSWLSKLEPQTLNVAGPRASKDPEIQEFTRDLLVRVFSLGEDHAV